MGLDCLIEKIEKAMGEGWEWEAWVVDRVVKEGGEMSMVGGGGGGATRACMAKILAACSKNGMEKLGGDKWMHERNEWECEHGGYGDGYVRTEEGMRWGDHARVV